MLTSANLCNVDSQGTDTARVAHQFSIADGSASSADDVGQGRAAQPWRISPQSGVDRWPSCRRGNVRATACQLADCWTALENFINDMPQPTAAIIKAALSHVQFETIHPFLDGNGRLGRMLIPLILVEARILQEPLLYFSVFFKQHRETYYSLLQQVRISGNWEAWLLFFADAIAVTANQAVSTAQALTQLLARDKARLAELGRLAGSAR